MSAHATKNPLDDLVDLDFLPNIRNLPGRQRRSGSTKVLSVKAHKRPSKPVEVIAEQLNSHENVTFTYQASRHEKGWITESMDSFFDGQWLSDVLMLVKGGKEANVYQCLAHPSVKGLDHPFIAAKVYRPRSLRNLRKDHLYREGRQELDATGRVVNEDGMLHAMAMKSNYGKELLHSSWIGHEVNAMEVLYAAGADVPRMLTSGSNAILMDYIGDADQPAPTLNTVSLGLKEARRLFERVVHNLELMLANNRIHGDLSAYNILYWGGEITLIDFPQAVHPDQNRSSFAIFERDVRRVCEYFALQGVSANPRSLATGMWKAHHRSIGPQADPKLLNPDDETDRRLWNQG